MQEFAEKKKEEERNIVNKCNNESGKSNLKIFSC